MTAVAQPPNLESLPRSGWNLSGSGGQGAFSAEEVTRMFATRKAPQRTNSSSSLSSNPSTVSKSSDSTATSVDLKSRKDLVGQGKEKEGWTQAKYSRGLLPQQKSEASTSTGSVPLNGRSQVNPPSNLVAVPTSSAPHQGPLLVPSQKMVPPPPMQANGVRMGMVPAGSDPPALLVLLPMNGTFERKQINVPLFPEILRIGRQTNAKTVPTPANGYFDSKVLSRQHAEVWSDRSGKVWIRDVKSSNGTFVNGVRLSPESRDSEPHELRENDMLELGIDIVSEDQKSIVHHKVSAKVEHAGMPTNATSVLDLNLGDIEPGSGGGLSMLPQNGPLRGRLGSQGSITSNGRPGNYPMNANVNALGGVQRHMGAWLSPITIEQVVKRLTGEMRQAKQQSQDLYRTSDFFTALINTEPGKEPPKPPADLFQPPPAPAPLVNGVSPHKSDHFSPFSQPPAPPPQLPLPEKPDVVRLMQSDTNSATDLRNVEHDRAITSSIGSPSKIDPSSSQILQLVEALSSAKREIDSQGIRVRQLEEQLKQERRAREQAEERARHFMDRPKALPNSQNLTNGILNTTDQESISLAGNASAPTIRSSTAGIFQDNDTTGSLAERLQGRVDNMIRDFEEMKGQVEMYRQRAESAEEERSSLAEMVEQIRQGNSQFRSHEGSLKKKRSSEMATQTDMSSKANGSLHVGQSNLDSDKGDPEHESNGSIDKSHTQMKQLHNAVTTALSLHQDDRLMQSAPYASILGVVIIGVGIMTYLNGWQKFERP